MLFCWSARRWRSLRRCYSRRRASSVLLRQGFFSFQTLASRASREGAVLSFEGLQAAVVSPKKHRGRLPLPLLSHNFHHLASHHFPSHHLHFRHHPSSNPRSLLPSYHSSQLHLPSLALCTEFQLVQGVISKAGEAACQDSLYL